MEGLVRDYQSFQIYWDYILVQDGGSGDREIWMNLRDRVGGF